MAITSRTIGVRWLLVGAVILIVVPAWSFATYVSWQYASAARQVIESAGRSTARSISSAADFRLTSIESAMTTLALSPTLQGGDLAGLYRDAEAFARTQRVVVALVSPGGEQIFNTNAPFGQALPATAPEARFAEAAATRQTQFSQVLFGNVTKRWLVTITMPTVRDDRVEHVLIVALDTVLHFGEMLGRIDMPPNWTVAVLDDANVIAARRPFPDRYVGQKAHPDVHGLGAGPETGSGPGRTMTNDDVHIFRSRLMRAPWVALVGIPRSDLDGIVKSALAPVFTVGLLVLLSSLLAAWTVGRRFTEQLISVSRYASAFRDGQNMGKASPSHITELAELTNTLEAAADERTRYETRLKGLIADKDLLMQEVHHRVKNSLQLVRGMLSLQARNTGQPDTKAALLAAAGRIMTVADIHQHLYQGHSTADINVGRYITDLAAGLASSLLPPEAGRRLVVDATDIVWPSERVTTLGLIITELVTNAIKYGAGNVTISLDVRDDGHGRLVISDEGSGFPEGFDLGHGSGLGSKLVTNLVRPDEGSITIDRSVPFGRVILDFKPSWRREDRL
jgi:two-component sensor histidine kinase